LTQLEGALEHCLRLRVEMQGNESSRFQSLLGRNNVVPGNKDRIDYMMMRRHKNAYYIENEHHEPDTPESPLYERFTVGK
jgi:hypothetical protein